MNRWYWDDICNAPRIGVQWKPAYKMSNPDYRAVVVFVSDFDGDYDGRVLMKNSNGDLTSLHFDRHTKMIPVWGPDREWAQQFNNDDEGYPLDEL